MEKQKIKKKIPRRIGRRSTAPRRIWRTLQGTHNKMPKLKFSSPNKFLVVVLSYNAEKPMGKQKNWKKLFSRRIGRRSTAPRRIWRALQGTHNKMPKLKFSNPNNFFVEVLSYKVEKPMGKQKNLKKKIRAEFVDGPQHRAESDERCRVLTIRCPN